MTSRQSIPECWSILSGELDREDWKRISRQPLRSGVVLVNRPSSKDLRRLRILARLRRLTIVCESPRCAGRVHNGRELRRALLLRCRLILLSPIHVTNSHPDWEALPRMRAGALARLAGRELLALGGMNARRYRAVAPLGFIGWAGISAWTKMPSVQKNMWRLDPDCPRTKGFSFTRKTV